MTPQLNGLIAQAARLAGSDPCHDGERCRWRSEGGRRCPHEFRENCGQAVYVCDVCEAYDHGEPGGPGARDCATACPGPDDYWHEQRDFGPIQPEAR